MAERLCVLTGSRAEYGLLSPVIAALKADPAFDVRLVVTGAHLDHNHGSTAREITADGHQIDASVELELTDDSRLSVAKSLGVGVVRLAEALERLRPERLLLAGDRYETLAAAQAALILNIPVVHLFGGDTSEGAFDETVRHSITKMSHLHLVTHEAAAERVRQLGEDPRAVVIVGNPGLDALRATPLLPRNEVERRLGFTLREHNLLVTFHPVSLSEDCGLGELAELLSALHRLGERFGLIITGPNADPGGLEVKAKVEDFVAGHANAILQPSLGRQLYWSVMAQADVVVGNSSTGLTEAPTLKKPAVNIGDRQRGRVAPENVIHCEPSSAAIELAIRAALQLDCSSVVNPYGDGFAVPKIVEALKRPISRRVLQKKFHRVGC